MKSPVWAAANWNLNVGCIRAAIIGLWINYFTFWASHSTLWIHDVPNQRVSELYVPDCEDSLPVIEACIFQDTKIFVILWIYCNSDNGFIIVQCQPTHIFLTLNPTYTLHHIFMYTNKPAFLFLNKSGSSISWYLVCCMVDVCWIYLCPYFLLLSPYITYLQRVRRLTSDLLTRPAM
jgi:hypothetical protein